MKPILRLYLSNGTLSAWILRRGELQQIACFAETSSVTDDFSRFLSQQATSGHLLLLDHAMPRLVAEALPATGFLAYRRLLALRLQRLHPDTRWRCALPLPAPPAGGRAAAFLALPESSALQEWLNCFSTTSVGLRGVHAVPLLLASFIARHRRLPNRLVIVSQHDLSTRLTLVQHGLPTAIAEEVQMPAEQIPETIANFNLCHQPPGAVDTAPPALCLLGTADWQRHIEAAGLPLRIVTRHSNSCIDLLAQPVWRWPRPRLATPRLAAQGHHPIGRALWLGGAAAGLGGLALTLAGQASLERLNTDIEHNRLALQARTKAIRDLEARAAGLGVTAESLPLLARQRHILATQREAFADNLHKLGAALDDTPDIELDALTWTATSAPFATAEPWQMQLTGHLSPQATPVAIRQLEERLRHSAGMRSTANAAPGSANFALKLTPDRP